MQHKSNSWHFVTLRELCKAANYATIMQNETQHITNGIFTPRHKQICQIVVGIRTLFTQEKLQNF